MEVRVIKLYSKTYCWWKKSCTSWYVKYPHYVYRVSYIPGGCLGLLLSRVSHLLKLQLNEFKLFTSVIRLVRRDPFLSRRRLWDPRFLGPRNAHRKKKKNSHQRKKNSELLPGIVWWNQEIVAHLVELEPFLSGPTWISHWKLGYKWLGSVGFFTPIYSK